MSAPDTTQQAAQTIEDVACETADNLLMDAADSVHIVIPPGVSIPSAILIAAHAIIAKLDSMETSQINALRDLQESLDFLGARTEGGELALKPTAHESEVICRALEEDYLLNHQAASVDEMDAFLRRFKKLAGL